MQTVWQGLVFRSQDLICRSPHRNTFNILSKGTLDYNNFSLMRGGGMT